MRGLISTFGAVALSLTLLLAGISESKAAITAGHTFLHQGKTWQQMSTVEKAQGISAILAVLIFFVAEIWFIVAGFQVSIGWGLFMLFIGGMRAVGAAIILIGWMVQWILLTRQTEPFHWPLMVVTLYVVFAGTGALVFFTRHWEQARKPLAVMAFGILLIIAVVGLSFAV